MRARRERGRELVLGFLGHRRRLEEHEARVTESVHQNVFTARKNSR
jgi:hypothetical protein